MGPDAFQEGLREYLRAPVRQRLLVRSHRAPRPRTPEDLAKWSHAWVEEAGRPDIVTHLEIETGQIDRLAFVQKDPAPRRGLVWTQRMEVLLGYDETHSTHSEHLQRRGSKSPTARGLPAPLFVLPAGGGIAYGGFELDSMTREYLLHHLADIPDALTRGSAMVTLWEDMLDGRSRAADVVED